MATVRLDQQEPHAREFTATVIAHAAYAARPAVVLDRSAFYPEAGGQQSDRGALTVDAVAHPVADVQIDDAGVVHHLIDGALPPVGAVVAGAIDRARRRVHMALHTGQHLLSRALIEAAGAPTVSARLGERDCTIDVTRDAVPERELAAAEALANAVIDDDVAIRAWWPTPDELAALPLRREPKVEREVRVIAIGDFDVSPCGGTHCTRSAQIGSMRILGSERYKGMTRVYFTAGARARGLLGEHSATLTAVARDFTCGAADVPAQIDKLRRALTDARGELTAMRERLAVAMAATLAPTPGPGEVITTVDDAALLRPLAAALNAAGKDALLAAPRRRRRAGPAGPRRRLGARLRRAAQAPGHRRRRPRRRQAHPRRGPAAGRHRLARRDRRRPRVATRWPWPSACRRRRTARAPSGCRPSSRRSAAGR